MRTKFHALLSLPLLSLIAYADSLQLNGEFPLIQPIAIEEAPFSATVLVPTTTTTVVIDSDGDGVLDDIDRCPMTPKGISVDANGCPIINDADKDGVPDADDQCPNTPLGTKVDYRGCEVDSDGDGVPDSRDKCPNTSKEFMVDGYGCPQTATLKVTFASGQYKLTDQLINQVQEFALFLKENKGYQVVIVGYTDSQGNKEKNKVLSQNRANSVKEALVRYGINETRLTAVGRGIENPIADNKTAEGRAANRRIEVELIQ